MELRTPEVLRRRRRGAALPPGGRAAVRRAARRERADPQARGRARRAALRPYPAQRPADRRRAGDCSSRRVACSSTPRWRPGSPRRTRLLSRRVKIGYVPDVLPGSLARALQHWRSPHRAVEVTLETGHALDLLQAVRDRRLDAAVTGLPAPTSGLRVAEPGPRATGGRGARAREVPRPSRSASSPPQRLLTLPREADPALYDTIVTSFRAAGLAPALTAVSESRIEAVLLGVAGGDGAALLPAGATERRALPGVRIVELSDADPAARGGSDQPSQGGAAGAPRLPAIVAGVVRRAERTPRLRIAA